MDDHKEQAALLYERAAPVRAELWRRQTRRKTLRRVALIVTAVLVATGAAIGWREVTKTPDTKSDAYNSGRETGFSWVIKHGDSIPALMVGADHTLTRPDTATQERIAAACDVPHRNGSSSARKSFLQGCAMTIIEASIGVGAWHATPATSLARTPFCDITTAKLPNAPAGVTEYGYCSATKSGDHEPEIALLRFSGTDALLSYLHTPCLILPPGTEQGDIAAVTGYIPEAAWFKILSPVDLAILNRLGLDDRQTATANGNGVNGSCYHHGENIKWARLWTWNVSVADFNSRWIR